jgi:hypothetical protein
MQLERSHYQLCIEIIPPGKFVSEAFEDDAGWVF